MVVFNVFFSHGKVGFWFTCMRPLSPQAQRGFKICEKAPKAGKLWQIFFRNVQKNYSSIHGFRLMKESVLWSDYKC